MRARRVEFYRREPPCLLAVLERAMQVAGPLSAVVSDGDVTLDASGRAGLEPHLHEYLNGGGPRGRL